LNSLREELYRNVDSEYAEFNRRLLPGTENILGVRMPVLRKTASELMKENWRSFLETDSEYHEEYLLKALIVANADISFEERIGLTRNFVPCIKNWAVCDLLCNDWKYVPEANVPLWGLCDEWLSSGEEFKMRTSVVMMLFKFIDDENIDKVLDRIASNSHDGYYYKMGAAWTLSFCYVEYPDKTENILKSGKLNPEIQNMTVRKIRESLRVSKDDKERIKIYLRRNL
jgi:3-methyladenine DNA glycosylase AlkD